MNWLTIGIVLLALVGVLLLALPTILNKLGLHPEYSGPSVKLPGKRALVITTSHSVLAAPGETKGKAGAIFESQTKFADFFATHVAVDDEKRFVTGQNQNSSLDTAHAMMKILSEDRAK